MRLPESDTSLLAKRSRSTPEHEISVDLQLSTISDNHGFKSVFEIDEFDRSCLLNGLDDIGLTLRHGLSIVAYEQKLQQEQPFLAFST